MRSLRRLVGLVLTHAGGREDYGRAILSFGVFRNRIRSGTRREVRLAP